MATHFARRIINDGNPHSGRLSASCLRQAAAMPEFHRVRFLASHSLLAELMLMLYGIHELPEISVSVKGRPSFSDPSLADFSIACAGNFVGIAIATEGRCGLDMELQHATRRFHHIPSYQNHHFQNHETIWINNQNDPCEAGLQLSTLRQSVLKLRGSSKEDEKNLQLLPGSGRLRLTSEPEVEAVCDAEDLLIWAVSATPSIENLKLWEFDEHQRWRSLPEVPERHRSVETRLMRFTSLSSERAVHSD